MGILIENSKNFIEDLISKTNFVDSKIATTHGIFNIRVYNSEKNLETVVLYSGIFSDENPPLVRVHSECITGDAFSSLKCDCGPQLNRALALIQKEGGIVIYLRQEGRGIGLFEKIKTYALQARGYDTFDANTLLGHPPDSRSYEMVKTTLDDLNIKKIRLLTNNPSKVSEIAKHGILVIEQIPLFIKPNEHNEFYFETKRKKFRHNFDGENREYFYQFHVDKGSELFQISKIANIKINNPFLQICIGINSSSQVFFKKEEQIRIQEIYHIAQNMDNHSPVLHFSFKNSTNPIYELEIIKELYPYVARIQLNDVENLCFAFLQKAFSLFTVDLPLSDSNFSILKDPEISSLIREHQGFILLDNSKGTGKTESLESYKEKIDRLLALGISKIVLCGGFGPNQLDSYFLLCKYYKINFSIDAESKLRKNNQVDIELTTTYLNQLLKMVNLPNQAIKQTKTFLNKCTRDDWNTTYFEDKEFLIHPKVFHAGKFPSTKWYAQTVSNYVKGQKDFCEIGCGCGLISCHISLKNPQINVVSIDIDPQATENTQINAEKLGISNRVRTFQGDVFDNLRESDKFDSIFWSLPWGYIEPNTALNIEERQVFDSGYIAINRFLLSAKKHLKPNGRLLIGFSNKLGSMLFYELAKNANLELNVLEKIILKEEEEADFLLLQGKYF